jgi:hypothetical protein
MDWAFLVDTGGVRLGRAVPPGFFRFGKKTTPSLRGAKRRAEAIQPLPHIHTKTPKK